MTLDSGNISFVVYLRGFHGEGASNNSGVIENIDFQGFRTLRLRNLRIIILSLVAFPLPLKYMTLNGLNCHFTLNFHYYELTLRVLLVDFESIIYLFTVESVYIHVTSGDVGSEVADSDPQYIWNPRKTADLSRALHCRNLNKISI